MPVRNEEAHIGRVIQALLDQRYPEGQYEILVVDGESTDATREIVASFGQNHPEVQLLRNPGRLSSSARNIGVRASRGELIVVVDGHCECRSPDYLKDLADAFERSGADCVGRPQPLDVEAASALQRAIAAARSSPLGHHPSSWIYAAGERFVPAASVAVAYRRSVFEKVGFFDEAFDACEDYEFNHRIDQAGLRCFFTDRVALHYAPRGSLRGLFRQLWRYGRGRVRLLFKHPDTARITTFAPSILVSGFLVGAGLIALRTPLAGWMAAGFALYLGLVVAFSLAAARQRDGWTLLPWLPAVFITIHLACGTSMLWEGLCQVATRPAGPPLGGEGPEGWTPD